MISHEHKCIFIHIPRTAGTFIEHAICGKDWWGVSSNTKHILASTAKEVYKDYWNDYFKFSIVRDPWDRMVSLSRYANHFGVKITNNQLDFEDYKTRYTPVEIDRRSKSKNAPVNPIPHAVYLNILDEDLDFIGKFEDLEGSLEYISDNVKAKISPPKNKVEGGDPNKKHYSHYYNDFSRKEVYNLYSKDIAHFNYSFKNKK